MNLTLAQKQALKADIDASELSGQPNTDAGNTVIAAAYNAFAAPDYWGWRPFIADSEMYEATTSDGTSWSWPIYIARSQGERDAWRQMVNMKGGINASLANTRAGIADIFSGAPGLAQRTHLLAIGRRKLTRFEKLFAVDTPGSAGTRGTTADPDSLGTGADGKPLEGVITLTQIEEARNS